MKITITLNDEENDHVRIDADPPSPKLVQIYKDGNPPAALIYAIVALSKLMKDSESIAKEERSGLIMPGGSSNVPAFIG